MDPKMIAEWVDDIGPNRLGIISEDLYGLRVIPGEHPMDFVIFNIEKDYLDFDIEDSKVQDIAERIYKRFGELAPKSIDSWIREIEASSQSDELKNKLLSSLKSPSKYKIVMNKGTVIEADVFEGPFVGRKGTKFYYVGINPTANGFLSRKKKHRNLARKLTDFFEYDSSINRYRWKFEKILTIRPENVQDIVRT